MDERWRIELFGGLRVSQAERAITRFQTRKTGALLAYLAYFLHRTHPRELLIDLFWPEADVPAGRQSLSQALSSLRHQLEPPGVPPGVVLIADRASVRLNPAAVSTDVAEFEAALQAAERATSRTERVQLLAGTVALYRGELLPGHYEDWLLPEQQRLAGRYFQAVRQLIRDLEQDGAPERALAYAGRAVAADPLREEAHQELMRLYAAAGQPAAALRQYRELARLLTEELDQEPSAATRRLAAEIGRSEAGVPAFRSETTTPPQHLTPLPPERANIRTADRSSPAPTGTVTFLLTDIEGSTSLWERMPGSFRAALASHHDLLRRAFRRHGGYEARGGGDAFIVAFARAGDALACAVAGQRALAAHAWPAEIGDLRVRMALHTGDAEFQEGEYGGLVLDYASRMLVVAHGGQILCSEVAAGVLCRGGSAAMEPGIRLRDLGVYRLRDVGEPERLFQVAYPGMAHDAFPPLSAETGYAGHLPLQFTRFFGREPELARLRELLLGDETRLVTLTGPGGSGKTRLALEAAGQLVDAFQGAVWFVPLADVTAPRFILDAILDALGLPRSPHLVPLEQLVEALARQPALLLLDTFEHLVAEGAPLVRRLLERAPELKCLVTSRQLLGLEAEREFVVDPLPVPTGAARPERLALNESVRLFVDRAQTVRADFQVTNANAPAIAELCRRLEGIPLAMELAAARAQVLTPRQMVAQLEHRFDFLVSRRRDTVARHRTLRAAIEWGYHLLAPELQRLFAALSVFRGGWTPEAAEAVCEEPLALDFLAQLRECSLVVAEQDAAEIRFRMLETLREFAKEHVAPEERVARERRHFEYFLALADEAAAGWRQQRDWRWLKRLEIERENYRVALEWSLTHEPGLALRLAVAQAPFWFNLDYLTEGRDALDRALARATDPPDALRAQALQVSGGLAFTQADYAQSRALLERSLELLREQEDRQRIAHVLVSLGRTAWLQQDDAYGQRVLEESLRISRELADEGGVADALHYLANLTFQRGNVAKARSLHEQCLGIRRRMGRNIHGSLVNLGVIAAHQGDFVTARALLEECLPASGEPRDRIRSFVHPLIHLGLVAWRQGEHAEARALLEESLEICRRKGDRRLIAECLEGLAELAAAQAQRERAVRLLGAASAVRDAIGFPVAPVGKREYEARINALREALGEKSFTAVWETGRALTWLQAADEALLDRGR